MKSGGKLLLYASTETSGRERLGSVREAAVETAEQLDLSFEQIRFTKRSDHIYIYYDNGNDEPVPIYCDEGKGFDVQAICSSLRKMMFVLSFHPRNSALRTMRGKLMGFS